MIRFLLISLICLSLPLTGSAQDKLPFDFAKNGLGGDNFLLGDGAGNSGADVTVTAELVAVDATAVDVKVTAKLPPKHHIYSHKPREGSIPTKISITASGLKLEGPIRPDRPPHVVTEYGATMEKFEDKVTWTQRLRSTTGPLQPGLSISGELTGQVCSETQCKPIDPPKTFTASLPADFVAPEGEAPPVTAPGKSTSTLIVPKIRGVADSPIQYTVSLSPPSASIGDFVVLSIKAELAEKHHTYSITQDPDVLGGSPTQITLDRVSGVAAAGEGFRASVDPEQKPGSLPGESLEIHHDSVEWTREFVVSDTPVSIAGTIQFLVCNENSCLPPAKASFAIQLGDGKTATTADSAIVQNPEQNADTPQEAGTETAWIPFLLSAVTGAFISLVTPCVFPMIPVTVGFFLKQGEEKPGSTIRLAGVYCLSIIGAFTSIGLLAAILKKPELFAGVANNPWLNLIFAAIFVAFSLMLLGMFEFRMPSWLLTWTSKKQETGGVIGVVFMALTFTLVSFTCTFAFVGNVLAIASTGKDFARPVIGMAAFGTAFASPFFLLAVFPSYLQKLPKSGGWMNRVKVTFGLLELAVVFKFLSVADIGLSPNGMPRYLDYHLVMGIWMAVAIVTGLYLLNVFRMSNDTPTDSIGPISCMFSLSCLGLAAYMAVGMFSANPPEGALWQQIVAFAPPQLNITGGDEGFFAEHDGLSYSLDFDRAVESASQSNKPMFLDFTGVNCINCRLMENGVLSKEPVHDVLEDLVRVQLYTDKIPGVQSNPSEHDRLLKRNHQLQKEWLKSVGIPDYVIATPDGKEILSRFSGLDSSSGEKFQKFLKTGLQKWESRQPSVAHGGSSTVTVDQKTNVDQELSFMQHGLQ